MRKRKVMVVDDEVDFLKMVKLNLETTGEYDVLTLADAKNIVSRLHDFRPDVILLDILMPAVGGIEACEILNKDSIGRTIPIIILSALGRDTDKLNAYKVGVVDYLVKPLKTEDITAAIDRALKYKNI